jgi:hypothetical protein
MRARLASPYASLRDQLQRIRHAARDFRQNRVYSRSPDQRSTSVNRRPAELRVVNEAMRKIDREVLPEIRERADPIAFILPTAIEWVGWESLRIADTDEEYRQHVLDLFHAGQDEPLLVLLGMLGSHLRQQSDEIDRMVLPLLLGIAFQRLQQSLDSDDMGAARRFAGIIVNALHFNPDYSLARDRVWRRTPYDFAVYQSWFSACFDEIRRTHPSCDARSLLRRSVVLFPSLLGSPGDPLPLPLQFADKSRRFMEQSGQDVLELLAQYVEQCDDTVRGGGAPTVWDFVSGEAHPVVRNFMRMRNHRIPRLQLELLTCVRDSMVRGTLMDGGEPLRP